MIGQSIDVILVNSQGFAKENKKRYRVIGQSGETLTLVRDRLEDVLTKKNKFQVKNVSKSGGGHYFAERI